MCMEDIRIARKTFIRQTLMRFGSSVFHYVPPDIKRLAILPITDVDGNVYNVYLGHAIALGDPTIINVYHAVLFHAPPMTIEQYGAAIVSELTILDVSGVGNEFMLHEVVLAEE